MQEKEPELKIEPSSSVLIDLKNVIINQRYQIIQHTKQTDTYIAYDHQSQIKYTVKYFNYEKIQKDYGQEFTKHFSKVSKIETTIMQSVNPEKDYICYCPEAIQTKDMKIIIQQYFPGNTLTYRVRKGYVHSQTDAILILKQIIKGYQYLRQKKVPVLCLEPDDIMQCHGKYKIVNFGLTKLEKIDKIRKENKQIQTAFDRKSFIAPEILKNQFYNLKAYVWNIGMLLFYMLNNRISERATNKILNNDQLMEVQTLAKKHISQVMLNFLSKCLEPNPAKRLSWSELISHQIFSLKSEVYPSQVLYDEQIKDLDLIDQHYYLSEERKYLNCLLQNTVIHHNTKYKIERIKTIFSTQAKKQKDLKEKTHQILSNSYLLLLQSKWNFENLITFFIYQYSNNKSIVQIEYLLLHRCFINLSDSLKQLTPLIKQGNLQAKVMHDLIQQFLKNYIEKQFQNVSSQLTTLQNSLKNRLMYQFTKLTSDNDHNKFFQGVEKIDFKKDKQINYTIQYYQSNVKKMLEKLKHESIESLIRNFQKYRQINFVSNESLKNKNQCFFEFIDSLDRIIQEEQQQQPEIKSKISITESNQDEEAIQNTRQLK